jgi:phosphoserine phosphatase RsbU/P
MSGEPSVLIIDDDPTSALMLERIFKKEGFRTCTAGNGPDGRNLAFQLRPDLILLDIMMPGENGFETCSKLKHRPETADIPIIFLSSLDQAKDKVTGFTQGAVDYVTKPFDKQEVLARARVHIKLRLAYAELIETQSTKFRQIQDAQQAILPKPEDIPEARFAIYYSPLQEAGGDFYDVLSIGSDSFGYFIADICGHDLGTSFLTAALKVLIAQYAGPLYTPAETIRMINGVLSRILKNGQYLTACYLLINRKQHRMKLTSAGHPPVIHLRNNGEADLIESTGDVLGAFEAITVDSIDIAIAEGDRLFLYSDGLIEINNLKNLARAEQIDILASACKQSLKLPLEIAASQIINQLDDGNYPRTDDWLFMAIEV